jgi:hypothetical protein
MEYIVNFAQKGKHFALQFYVATLICVQVVKIIYDRATVTTNIPNASNAYSNVK